MFAGISTIAFEAVNVTEPLGFAQLTGPQQKQNAGIAAQLICLFEKRHTGRRVLLHGILVDVNAYAGLFR